MAMEWVELDSIERVVVIGAGLAGLQTVRALARAGFAVTCLEAQDVVGGVWTRKTHGYTLQVPWEMYTFPDFPYPPELVPKGKSATSKELAAYMQAYSHHFHLGRHIRLHSRVLEVVASPTGWGKLGGPNTPWLVRYEDVATRKQYALPASLVILATGQFSTPFLPHFQGANHFQGMIVHAKDAVDLEMFRGKKVVVVGSGKTGMDLVAEIGAVAQAESVTVVYKTSHWCLPEELDGQAMADVLLSKHTAAQLPPYYTHYQGHGNGCLRGGSAVPEASLSASQTRFWERLAGDARQAIAAPKMEPPNLPLIQDMFNGAQIFASSWMDFMHHNSVAAVQGHVAELSADSVVLKDGRKIPCDILLCCTGYQNHYRFLDSKTSQLLNLGQDGLYLYRGMLPPAVPNLFFIGAEAATLNTMLTTALQSEWILRLLTGVVALPSRAAMEADVELQRQWRRRIMPAARNRGGVYALYASYYWKQLLRDMGEKARQGSWWAKRQSASRALRPSEVAHLITSAPLAIAAHGGSLKSSRHHRLAVTLGGEHQPAIGMDQPSRTSMTCTVPSVIGSELTPGAAQPISTEEAHGSKLVQRISTLIGRSSAQGAAVASPRSSAGVTQLQLARNPSVDDRASDSTCGPAHRVTLTVELLAEQLRLHHEAKAAQVEAKLEASSPAADLQSLQEDSPMNSSSVALSLTTDSPHATGTVQPQSFELTVPAIRLPGHRGTAASSGLATAGFPGIFGAADAKADNSEDMLPHGLAQKSSQGANQSGEAEVAHHLAARRSVDQLGLAHGRSSLVEDGAPLGGQGSPHKGSWHWSELLQMGGRASVGNSPRLASDQIATARRSLISTATAALLHAPAGVAASPDRGAPLRGAAVSVPVPATSKPGSAPTTPPHGLHGLPPALCPRTPPLSARQASPMRSVEEFKLGVAPADIMHLKTDLARIQDLDVDPAFFTVLASAAMQTLGLDKQPSTTAFPLVAQETGISSLSATRSNVDDLLPAAVLSQLPQKAAPLAVKGQSILASDLALEDSIPAWGQTHEPLHISWEPGAVLPVQRGSKTVATAGPVGEGQESAFTFGGNNLHVSWEPETAAAATAPATAPATGPVAEGRKSVEADRDHGPVVGITPAASPGVWRASAVPITSPGSGPGSGPPARNISAPGASMDKSDKWHASSSIHAGSAAQAAREASTSSRGSIGDRLKAFGSFIRRWSGEFSRGSTPRESFDRSSTYDSTEMGSGAHARSSGQYQQRNSGSYQRNSGSYQRNSGAFQRNSMLGPVVPNVDSSNAGVRRGTTVAELRAQARPQAAGPDRNSGIEGSVDHQLTRSSGNSSSSQARAHRALSNHWLGQVDGDSAPPSASSNVVLDSSNSCSTTNSVPLLPETIHGAPAGWAPPVPLVQPAAAQPALMAYVESAERLAEAAPAEMEFNRGTAYITRDSSNNGQRRSLQHDSQGHGSGSTNFHSTHGGSDNTRSGMQLSMDEWIDDDGNPASTPATQDLTSFQYTVGKPSMLMTAAPAATGMGWPPPHAGARSSSGPGESSGRRSADWAPHIAAHNRQASAATNHHVSRSMIMHMEEATQLDSLPDMLPMISEDARGEKGASGSSGHANSGGVPSSEKAIEHEHVFSFGDQPTEQAISAKISYHVQVQAAASPAGRSSPPPNSNTGLHGGAAAVWSEHYSVTSNVLRNLGPQTSMALDTSEMSMSQASNALRRLSGRVAAPDSADLWEEGASGVFAGVQDWEGTGVSRTASYQMRNTHNAFNTYNSVTSLVLSRLAGAAGAEASPLASTTGLARLSGRVNDDGSSGSGGEDVLVRQMGYSPEHYSVTSNVLRNVGSEEATGGSAEGAGPFSSWPLVLRRLSGRVEVDKYGNTLTSGAHAMHLSTGSNVLDGGDVEPVVGSLRAMARRPRPQVAASAAMYSPLVTALLGARQQHLMGPEQRRASWAAVRPASHHGLAQVQAMSRLQSHSSMPRLTSRFSDSGASAGGAVLMGGVARSSSTTVPRPPARRSVGSYGAAVVGQPYSAHADIPGHITPATTATPVTPSRLMRSALHPTSAPLDGTSVAPAPAALAVKVPSHAPKQEDDSDGEDFHSCPNTPGEGYMSADEAGQLMDTWQSANNAPAEERAEEQLMGGALDQVLMADYVRLLQELGMLPDKFGPEDGGAEDPSQAVHATRNGMPIIDRAGDDDQQWMDGHAPDSNGDQSQAPVSTGEMSQNVLQRLTGRIQPSASTNVLYNEVSTNVLHRLTGRVMPSGSNALPASSLGRADTGTTMGEMVSGPGAVGRQELGGMDLEEWLQNYNHWSQPTSQLGDSNQLQRLSGRVLPSESCALAQGHQSMSMHQHSGFDTLEPRSSGASHTLYRLTGRVMPSGANSVMPSGYNSPAPRSHDVEAGGLTYTPMGMGNYAMLPSSNSLMSMHQHQQQHESGQHVQPSDMSVNVLHRLTGRVIPSGSNAMVVSPSAMSHNGLHRLTGRVMPSNSNNLLSSGPSATMPRGPLSGGHAHMMTQSWDAEDGTMFNETMLQHGGGGWLQEDHRPHMSPYVQHLPGTRLRKSSTDARNPSSSTNIHVEPPSMDTLMINSARRSSNAGARVASGAYASDSFQLQPNTQNVIGLFHAQLCTALLARNPVREALAELMALSDRLGLPASPSRSQTPTQGQEATTRDLSGAGSAPHDLATLDPGLLAALQSDIAGLPDRLAAALAPFSTSLAAAGGAPAGVAWPSMPAAPPQRLDGAQYAAGSTSRGDRRGRPVSGSNSIQHRRGSSAAGPTIRAEQPSQASPVHHAAARSADSSTMQVLSQAGAAGKTSGNTALGLLIHDVSLLTNRLTAKLQQQHPVGGVRADAAQPPAAVPHVLVHASASSFPTAPDSNAQYSRSSSRTPGGGVRWEAGDGTGTPQQSDQLTSQSNSFSRSGIPSGSHNVISEAATMTEGSLSGGAAPAGAWVDQVLTRLLLQDLDGLPERVVMSHHVAAAAAGDMEVQAQPTLRPYVPAATVTHASGGNPARSHMHLERHMLQHQQTSSSGMSGAGTMSTGSRPRSGTNPAASAGRRSPPPPAPRSMDMQGQARSQAELQAAYEDVVAGLLLSAERDVGALAAALTGAPASGAVEGQIPMTSRYAQAQAGSRRRSPTGVMGMSSHSSASDMHTLRRLAGRVAPSGPPSHSDLNMTGYSSNASLGLRAPRSRAVSSTGLASPAMHGPTPGRWLRRPASSRNGNQSGWDTQTTDFSSSGTDAPSPPPFPMHTHTVVRSGLAGAADAESMWQSRLSQQGRQSSMPAMPVTGFGRVVNRAWGPEDDRDSSIGGGSEYLMLSSALRSQPGADALDGQDASDAGALYPMSGDSLSSPGEGGALLMGGMRSTRHTTLTSNTSSLSLVLRRLSGRLMDSHPATPSWSTAAFHPHPNGHSARGWD